MSESLNKQTLLHKLNTHSANVAIIGLALQQAQDKATWACPFDNAQDRHWRRLLSG